MSEAERLNILQRRVSATEMVLKQEGVWQVHCRPAPTYPPTLAFAQQPTGVLTVWYPTRAGVCQGLEASTSRNEVSQPGSNERRGAPRRTPAAADTPHEWPTRNPGANGGGAAGDRAETCSPGGAARARHAADRHFSRAGGASTSPSAGAGAAAAAAAAAASIGVILCAVLSVGAFGHLVAAASSGARV